MAIGDVYQLVDDQRYLGQRVLNIYHYVNRRESSNAQGLADGFVQDVLPFITPCQSPNLEHVSVEVINLDDDTDFAQVAVNIPGNTAAAGDDMASFYALRIRLLRSSRAIRNGSKRYAGVLEGGVNSNSVGTVLLTPLSDLASALTNPVTAAPTGEFDLVLYGKVTPNRPEPIVVDIDAAVADPFVTTQNSRKAWVGR